MSGFFGKMRRFFSATDEYNVAADSFADSVTNVTEIHNSGAEVRRTVPAAAVRRSASAPRTEIIVFRSDKYKSDRHMSNDIAAALRENKSVLVDLSRCNTSMRSRVVDFASGMVYMAQGQSEVISENVFLFTAHDVMVTVAEPTTAPAPEVPGAEYGEAEPQRYRRRAAAQDDYI